MAGFSIVVACEANAQIPLSDVAGNNTSACAAAGNPSYCRQAFHGNQTRASNSEAQTVIVNPSPGNVNFSDLHALLYPGSTSKILIHFQPWFGHFEHISVGYDSRDKAVVANQIAKMMALGGYGLVVDWYGSTNPKRDFFVTTTNVIAKYLSSCFSTTCPFHMAIMEDKGAFSSQCAKGKDDRTGCLIKNIEQDMDYIRDHYANQPWYVTRGGNPIVLFFLHEPEWRGSDWNRIWSEVKEHTNGYQHPFLFVFEEEDANCWRHPNGDGCYVWMNPGKWSPQAQFNWGASTNPDPVYYREFYENAVKNPNKVAIGAIKKGFDDNNASWGENRVTAQQCGQTFLNTIQLISKYYNSTRQLEFLGVPTWNDYEEGSEVETGIDNCYTISAEISGQTVRWQLQTGSSYATPATIDHFTVYYADRNNMLHVVQDNVPPDRTSLALKDAVPKGSWNIYVRMVAKPLFINRMSSPLLYSAGD